MSEARKCDRCGTFYEKTSKSRIVYEYFPAGVSTTKNCGDVCPRCAAKFDRWWNKKRRSDAE